MTEQGDDATIKWQVGIQWMVPHSYLGIGRVEGHPAYSYTSGDTHLSVLWLDDDLFVSAGIVGAFSLRSGNHVTLDEAKADLEEQLRAAKGIGLGAVTE
jgi:hypothetical protein